MPLIEITGPLLLPDDTPVVSGKVTFHLQHPIVDGATLYVPETLSHLTDGAGEFATTVNLVTGGHYLITIYIDAFTCDPLFDFCVLLPASFGTPSSFADLYNLTDVSDLPTPLPSLDNFPAGSGSLGQALIHDGVDDANWGFLDAEYVVYDNTTSGLAATDVQAAIDEVATHVTSNYLQLIAPATLSGWQFNTAGFVKAMEGMWPGTDNIGNNFKIHVTFTSVEAGGFWLYAPGRGSTGVFPTLNSSAALCHVTIPDVASYDGHTFTVTYPNIGAVTVYDHTGADSGFTATATWYPANDGPRQFFQGIGYMNSAPGGTNIRIKAVTMEILP